MENTELWWRDDFGWVVKAGDVLFSGGDGTVPVRYERGTIYTLGVDPLEPRSVDEFRARHGRNGPVFEEGFGYERESKTECVGAKTVFEEP